MRSEYPFKITARDKHSNARTGVLRTPHGKVYTPAYVMVATHGQIKTLRPTDIKKTKTQIVIANTYHLLDKMQNLRPPDFATTKSLRAGEAQSRLKTFILEQLKTNLPTMTDSGGFQIFSLGAAKKYGVGKIIQNSRPNDRYHSVGQAKFKPLRTDMRPGKNQNYKSKSENSIRILEKGVYFAFDGEERFLSPEISMAIQDKIGADIIFAFDECTSPLHNTAYNKKAMERTHRWALRCIKAKKSRQMLFGIVQGGRSQKLREQSARIIGAMPFDGFGIGGSFGEDEMPKTLATVVRYLPENKPRHLLGIGKIKDIFNAVQTGVDTFDCVIPTREARHGRIWTAGGSYDIRKQIYAKNRIRLEHGCRCPVCKSGITMARLHALFKTETSPPAVAQSANKAGLPAVAQSAKAGRLATLHNIWFFNTLMEKIRDAIKRGTLKQLRRRYRV